MSNPKILIEDSYDVFSITIDGKYFHFDQEDTREGLIEVFQAMGFKAKYEEVC